MIRYTQPQKEVPSRPLGVIVRHRPAGKGQKRQALPFGLTCLGVLRGMTRNTMIWMEIENVVWPLMSRNLSMAHFKASMTFAIPALEAM